MKNILQKLFSKQNLYGHSESMDSYEITPIFCHNVLPQTSERMKRTIAVNRRFFPDSPIHIAAFGKKMPTDFFGTNNITLRHFGGNRGHKPGAYTGMVCAVRNAIKMHKTGLLVFSHDDVRIHDKALFLAVLERSRGFDIILRKPDWIDDPDYLMFDTIILSINERTKALFRKIKKVRFKRSFPKDIKGSRCPEMLFGRHVNSSSCSVFTVPYTYKQGTWGQQNHGFYHEPGRGEYMQGKKVKMQTTSLKRPCSR